MLLSLGLVLPFAVPGRAQTPVPKLNKVMIEPGSGDSIAQLKQTGIARVDTYGSFWIVEATDAQTDALKKTFGDRVSKANYLNKIELQSMTLDTTEPEPVVPQALRQAASSGTRLRLVQFKGPIQPEWLDQVKAAGNARIVSYIPNNAYVVSLDQQAEDNLGKLMAPSGPIQWVGPYHPYYKMNPMLPNAMTSSIDVEVGIVNGPEAEQTVQTIDAYALGRAGKPSVLSGQMVTRIKISPSNLPVIAQLQDVLWIQPFAPLVKKDESQSLVMADRISQLPGHSPVPGVDNYLDFLTNVVGFSTDPAQYPVLDIADTLSDPVLFAPDFYEFGSFANPTRFLGELIMCSPVSALCDDFHGPFVASVAMGANIGTTNFPDVDVSGFRKGLGVSPFGRFSITEIFKTQPGGCLICEDNLTRSGWTLVDAFHYLQFVEYFTFGARIANNSWGEGVGIPTFNNGGAYDSRSLAFDGSVRDVTTAGLATSVTTITNVIGSNSVITISTNTITVTPSPFPLNQEMITVFAAGDNQNLGTGVGGFMDLSVVPPATAKNVISVGATENARPAAEAASCLAFPSSADNTFDMYTLSSFGPTLDGRIKPEIVAPGSAIFGLNGLATNFTLITFPFGTNTIVITNIYFQTYTCGSGTSFAAPAVSGAIQLLWWYFQNRLLNEQGQHLLQPSPAMAKAYTCNAARYLPITNPQTGVQDTLPSIAQGMGEIDLSRMFDGVPRLIRDETTPRAIDNTLITTNPIPHQTFFSRSGQSYEVSGTVADPTQPFRVTLAWTDAPGNPVAFKQLVNDLDLQVTIAGQTYKGNVFVGPNSVPGGSFDDLNNMESVFLPGGQTGTWSVVVRAINIADQGVPNVGAPNPNQDFALVVYNSAASPVPTDVPNPATNNSCQTALAITSFPFTFSNNLTKPVYQNVHPSPSAGRGGADEFFQIVRPTAGAQFTVDTFGSSFDNILSVWRVQVFPQTVFVTGPCGSLIEQVSSGSSSNGIGSQVSFVTDGLSTYFIIVEPHNNGPGGPMVLNVQMSGLIADLSPGTISFGSQSVGTTTAVQNVTYTNMALVAINIDDAAVTGANASDFLILSQDCAGSAIPSGGSCNIRLAFAPTATGPRNGQLVVTDEATGSPRIVPLTGFGLPPAPVICLNTSSLSFGGVSVGSTGSSQRVTINNCGSAALFITNIVFSGIASNDYVISGNTCSGSTILPGGSCRFNVSFSPTAGGSRPAALIINGNASSGRTAINLTGTGQSGQPDLWIGKNVNLSKFIGVNLLTPPNPIRVQTLTQNGGRGQKRVFYIAFQNTGDAIDSFRVQGNGSVANVFTVKYFLGSNPSQNADVTGAITNGTFTTARMSPGAFTSDSTMLRVEITPAKNAPPGANAVTITATSVVSPGKTDSVQAVVSHR
jgi:hypothetical protein